MKAIRLAAVVGMALATMQCMAGIGPHLWKVKVTGTTFEGTGADIIEHKLDADNLANICKLPPGASLVLDTSDAATNKLVFVSECGNVLCTSVTLLTGDATCALAANPNGGEEVCTINFFTSALGGADGTVICELKLANGKLKGTCQGPMVAGGLPGFINVKVLGPFKPSNNCPTR